MTFPESLVWIAAIGCGSVVAIVVMLVLVLLYIEWRERR